MPYKHGHSNKINRSPTYKSWAAMKYRCLNPKSKNWPRYGGRGIKVCARWNSFTNFLKDMGIRPENTSIHRIDNNKGYFPKNCKWATKEEQSWGKQKTALSSTKKYRGVSKLPSGRYAARILNCHIGTYDTDKEAACAFNKIAKKLYKRNAWLNDVKC